MFDLFVKFNRKSIDDRKIDTLIGLSKGITADGRVNKAEAGFLYNWLIQSRQSTDNPIIANLLEKVDAFFEDGVLEKEELAELLGILQKISGNPSEIGELAKTPILPIDTPPPEISFPGNVFVFTGTCAFGTRRQCHDATEGLGGSVTGNISRSVDYLVLGTYVSEAWIHETYGRKIEKAMEHRDDGLPIQIVTEEHWAATGKLI